MPPPSDSGSILPPASAPLREIIGDFEIVAKIGQGGMGAVYRARQVSLDRQIALKLLPAQMVGDEDAVARFRREARVASSLSHANLVAVYAAGEADGCHFIAMELIEGEDLGRRLKRDGKPSVPEALRICAEVARGLDHGWRSAQLIHRDIKPANIFLATDGAVKLGDLGLAKTLGSLTTGLTQSGTMLGTPHYMSPEQARGDREIDFRADIYSLGCTLYQMLTGQVPYRGGDAITIIRQHLDAPLPAIMKVWPQCPVPLARLVGRMLKKSRHERSASYTELLGQIDSVWAQIDPVGHSPEAFAPPPRHVEAEVTAPPAEPLRPRPAPRSKGLLYGGLAAGVLVLAAVALIFWPKPEPLTKAQIMAAQRSAAARASADEPAGQPRSVVTQTPEGGGGGNADADKGLPTKAPLATASAVGTYPQPRVWIDDTENLRSGLKDGSLVADGEWMVAPKSFWPNLGGGRSFRDSAVRVVFSNTAAVYLRGPSKVYVAQIWKKRASITMYDGTTRNFTDLKGEVEMGTAYVPDATHELVFAAQGTRLSMWLDGREMVHVSDSTLTAGKMGLGLMTSAEPAPRIKKVEYGELEAADTGQLAVPPASGTLAVATKDARLSPSAEPWRDGIQQVLAVKRNGVKADAQGVVFQGNMTRPIQFVESSRPNGAVRVLVGGWKDSGSSLHLIVRSSSEALYEASFSRTDVQFLHQEKTNGWKDVALQKIPLPEPLVIGSDVELELRVVGKRLTAKVNGKEVGGIDGAELRAGPSGVAQLTPDPTVETLVRAIQYLVLPDDASTPAAAGGASTTPTAAWKPVVLTRDWMAKQGGASLSASGEVKITGGWFDLPNSFGRDIAMRGEIRQPPGDFHNNIFFRVGEGLDSRFLAIYPRQANLQIQQLKDPIIQYPILSYIKYPPEMEIVDKWVPFEFATVGKLSFATVQSLAFSPGTSEKAVQSGKVGLMGRMDLRKLEVVILDGVPEAQWPEFIRAALKQSGAKP